MAYHFRMACTIICTACTTSLRNIETLARKVLVSYHTAQPYNYEYYYIYDYVYNCFLRYLETLAQQVLVSYHTAQP